MKKSLSQKFGIYSAIGVAGGMTFGSTSAEADIIITDINMSATVGQPLGIDFDGDGNDEFVFDLRPDVGQNAYGSYSNWAAIGGVGTDDLFVSTDPSPFGGQSYGPNNLMRGDVVSGGLSFAGDGPLQLAYTNYSSSLNFGAFNTLNPSGYIGVQFDFNGSNVFGWIEVDVIGDVTQANFANAEIFVGRIAFEDDGSPITILPEPSSIGLLAMGAAALAWRRRRNK